MPISSYSIDGGNATTFNASKILQDVQYQRQFFQSKELTPANHTIVITTLSDNAYFILDYIAITPLVDTAPISSSIVPYSTISPVASSKVERSLGPIIAGILGGLALLIVAFIAFSLFRRRANNRSDPGESKLEKTPVVSFHVPLFHERVIE